MGVHHAERCQEWELGVRFHSNKMQVLANMGITSRRSSHMSWIARRKPSPSMMQPNAREICNLVQTIVPLHDLHPLDKQTLKAPMQPPAPRLPTPASSLDPISPWPKTCSSVRESTMLYPRGLSAHPGYQRSAMQARAQALSRPKCPIGCHSPNRSPCGSFQSGL